MKMEQNLEQKLPTCSFGKSVLRMTTRTARSLATSDVADWVESLPQHHELDEPIDRLLVGVFPQLSPAMIHYYDDRGPSCVELHPPATLREIDQRLSGFLVALSATLGADPQLRNLSLAAPEVLLQLMVPRSEAYRGNDVPDEAVPIAKPSEHEEVPPGHRCVFLR